MKYWNWAVAAAAALALVSSPAVIAQGAAKSVFTPVADLKWTNAGVPGVASAVVKGDMAKGASHFYLKYGAGFVAPVHHHSPDHYVTTVTGDLILVVDGRSIASRPGRTSPLPARPSTPLGARAARTA